MIDGYATETRAGERGPVVVRTAGTDAARHLLAQEADRLGRSRHPGVVELLDTATDQITIAWAGAQTLELLAAPVPVLCGVLTSVASTVADLHEIGMIHGRLDASHVVIDAKGRPRLCGMRGSTPDEPVALPTDDVAAIGALIDHLAGTDTELEPIPDRRWSRRRWTGYQRRALQLVADRATHEDPARRPTARELAAAIAEAVPDAQLVPPPTPAPAAPSPPDDGEPTEPTDRAEAASSPPPPPPPALPPADAVAAPQPTESPTPRSVGALPADPSSPTFLGLRLEPPHSSPDGVRLGVSVDTDSAAHAEHPYDPVPPASPGQPSRRAITIVMAALVAVIVGALALNLRATDRDQPLDAATGPSPAPVSTTPPPVSTPPSSDPTPTRCSLSAPTNGPDLDGDGCPDPVEIDGSRVTADGVSFEVGEPGDRVEVADWNCDGRATAAIVRPNTGEIFVFTQWVRDEEPLSVTPTTVVPGAVGLMEPDDGPCTTHHLVRVVGGTTVSVDFDAIDP